MKFFFFLNRYILFNYRKRDRELLGIKDDVCTRYEEQYTRFDFIFISIHIQLFYFTCILFRSSKRDRHLRAWHVLDCAFVNTNSMHTRVLESNQPTFSYSRVSHFDRLELFIWGASWLRKKKIQIILSFFFSKYRMDIDFYVCFTQITKPLRASKSLSLHFPGSKINFHSDMETYAILHDTIPRAPTYRDPIERNESYSLVTRFEAHHTIFTSNSNLPRRHKTLHQR